MKTKIYGHSDDLIEIEGFTNDEFNCYSIAETGFKFSCSDGTNGKINYNGDWKYE